MGVHGMDSLAFAPAAFSEGVAKHDTLADQIASAALQSKKNSLLARFSP